MARNDQVTIMMFGAFFSLRRKRGLQPSLTLTLPPEGKRAVDIARELDLPLDSLGAVYCNHLLADPRRLIHPGDRVAFLPKSLPGPHNALNGFPPTNPVEGFPQAAMG